ncbi:MAG: hypothetical protein IPK98_11380 [Chloracidobacterium sp.]|nr:hypothetical protein [Chloracidobacterium sp.]
MIKINLLNSVTERQGGAIVAVDRKISSPKSRMILMSVVVSVLLAAVIGWDVISYQMAKTEAERQLDEQKQIAAELEVVMNEQKSSRQRSQISIRGSNRSNGCDRRRPARGAVLDAMRERIAMVPGLYIEKYRADRRSVLLSRAIRRMRPR